MYGHIGTTTLPEVQLLGMSRSKQVQSRLEHLVTMIDISKCMKHSPFPQQSALQNTNLELCLILRLEQIRARTLNLCQS